MGNRCSNASPVSEPTARLMQNWMLIWNTLVQEVHSRIEMPNMDVSVITTLARVAYKYPAKREKEKKKHVLFYPEQPEVCVRVGRSSRVAMRLLSDFVSSSGVLGSVVLSQAPLRICWTSAGLSRAKPDRPRFGEAELLCAR